jgi:hypothetical protein
MPAAAPAIPMEKTKHAKRMQLRHNFEFIFFLTVRRTPINKIEKIPMDD